MNPSENKLSEKYPIWKGKMEFINKVMAKKRVQKYFDSADYEMARIHGSNQALGDGSSITGSVMPTAEGIAARKQAPPTSRLGESNSQFDSSKMPPPPMGAPRFKMPRQLAVAAAKPSESSPMDDEQS